MGCASHRLVTLLAKSCGRFRRSRRQTGTVLRFPFFVVRSSARSRFLGEALGLSRFPIATLEETRRLKSRSVDAIETAGVDADLVGLRARHIEGVDAAMRAEGMLRYAGEESVGGERLLAREQLEILLCGDEVQDPLLRADRAVAFRNAI